MKVHRAFMVIRFTKATDYRRFPPDKVSLLLAIGVISDDTTPEVS